MPMSRCAVRGVEVGLVAPAVEDRQHELRRERPGQRTGLEQPEQVAARDARAAGERDAREERRPRRADVGVGGAQLLLGLADVGSVRRADPRAGRPAARAPIVTPSSVASAGSSSVSGLPDQQHAAHSRPARAGACSTCSATRAPCTSDSACATSSAELTPLSNFSRVSRSDASRVSSVRSVRASCSLVGAQREVGVGDRRDQDDLHRLARLLGRQVLAPVPRRSGS